MQAESAKDIKHAFSVYLQKITVRYMIVKLVLAIFVLVFFAYADITILNSVGNFYSRLLPLGIAIPLLIFHLFTKNRFRYLKTLVFNSFVASLLISMYFICIVHVNKDTLAAAVAATLFVIFIISLEIKFDTISAAILYFLPTLLLLVFILFNYDLDGSQHLIMSNIYMFTILSFSANRIQNSLRFKAFQSNYLLNQEKQKTE